jgi:hypothetical protein
MLNEIIKIANFMGEAFLHIWPYLLVTIPLAVAVNMSGASKYIKRVCLWHRSCPFGSHHPPWTRKSFS